MKKIILMSLMLALTIMNANAYEALAGFDGPTWDAYTEAITEGSGTESSPYLIKTAGQLAQLAFEVNNGDSKEGQYYQIAADISLNKRENGERVLWVPIGLDESHAFSGTLKNPDGFVITDMRINVNSTETTGNFGLLGYLKGTVDGVRLAGSSEIVLNGSGNYNAGLLCGVMYTESHVSKCNVEDSYITGKNLNGNVCVGGLVGISLVNVDYLGEHGRLSSCIVKTTLSLEGDGTKGVTAGGVVGANYGKILDCHAFVEMTATNFSTSVDSYLGGIIGQVGGGPVKYCSASGNIKAGTGMHALTGGAFGKVATVIPQYDIKLDYCVTAATISGGHTLGGLIGYCYVIRSLNVNMNSNFSGSFVDAGDAAYAGGLIGHLEYKREMNGREDFWLGEGSFVNGFCGTMKRPKSMMNYGVILGHTSYVPEANFSKMAGYYFYYNHRMCDYQLNGNGYAMRQAIAYGGSLPDEDGYGTWGISYGIGETGSLENPSDCALYNEVTEDRLVMCNIDNYRLCALLFYITNDKKTTYKATDVTTDFCLDDLMNSTTGDRVCIFTVPDNLSCVRVEDKNVYPLDPGEVVVTMKWNGLERKIHLDITYGLDWTGGSSEHFDNVHYSNGSPDDRFAAHNADGSAEKPYLIHHAEQLNGLLSSSYNKAGVHVKLACDLFFNTHLLKTDGTPREDAIPWNPRDFLAHLDGNGKTIYGVYVDKSSLGDGESLGFFNCLYGTVKNLAIVDSNVSTNEVSNPNSSVGLLCGTLKEGASVSNCLFHGRVNASSYCGGIAGRADASNTSITDCFANVHVTFPTTGSSTYTASGICTNSPATMEYCLSTGRVENFIYRYGISEGAGTTCHYDKQMMAGDDFNQTIGSKTAEILSSKLMGGSNAWQQDDERYPMLKTFANTPYGKLLNMPVLFDDTDERTDRAGDVNYIFEFPYENVSWSALHDQTYIDVINDCGAASIVERTDDDVEILIAQAENVESQCTKAMRTLPLNLRSGITSFRFKDPIAKSAAFAAFNHEAPEDVITLRELATATTDDFDVFNREATGLQWFPEFRYFTNIKTLQEGMLSGLDQLCELELPKKLTTIEKNSFNGCSSLDSITMPKTFSTLEEGALYGSGIKNLLVHYQHPNMESIDGALFQNCSDGKHLVAYPPGRGEESATISTVFHYIDDYAFYKIPNLKNVYIDNCLPEGNYVDATDNEIPIVPEEGTDILEIYVNDGSYGSIGGTEGSMLFPKYEDENSFWGYYYEGHLHIYYPLNMTSAGWATLYIGFPTRLPEGFNAYVVSVCDDDAKIAKLKNIGRVIPKTTPVVIKNTAGLAPGIYPLTRWEGTLPSVPKYTNRFVGTYIGQEGGKFGIDVNQETSITGGVLTLGRNSKGVVGFYKYNGTVLPPYRAYLTTNTLIEGAKGFTFVIDDTIDETPTAIQNAPSLRKEQSSVYYDMTGRALQGIPTRPGVYIRNGKRFVVK